MKHFIKKLFKTIKLLSTLLGARMFGKYMHSGWNGEFAYACYQWHGKEWIIPTSPVDGSSIYRP
jgi:hypothetical protein